MCHNNAPESSYQVGSKSKLSGAYLDQARQVFELLLITNEVTRSLQGNTKSDLFVWPELVTAVHQSEGFVFPNTNQETRLLSTLLYDTVSF